MGLGTSGETSMKHSLARGLLAGAGALAAGSAHADLVFDLKGSGNYSGFLLYGGLLSHAQAGDNGYLVLEDGPPADLILQVPLTATNGWDNWSQYLGGTFSFDVKFLNDVQTVSPSFGRLTVTRLFNGEWVSVDLVPETIVSTTSGWTTYSVALTPEAGWGPSLASVLAAPQAVILSFETGSTDSNRSLIGIDNVRVTSAVPEPSTGLTRGMG